MGVKQAMCLALLAALFVGCRGQAFGFNSSATYVGSRIIVGITVTSGDPSSITFQCQLDNGPFQTCSDGFEFTSVIPGTHFVTVRGTSSGQSIDATLGPLTSVPELTVSLTVSVSGTVVTATIEANQAATFECQLDNEPFMPCISGFQYTGVAGGQHTITVRATSTATGLTTTTTTPSFEVRDEDAIFFTGISATQDISAETVTFTFAPSENFPVQCSIDGGAFFDCSSPYVADVSSLSSGVHTITFNAIVNGEVRGSATQSFLVAEGVLVEFKDSAYSVIEDQKDFNVTLVRQGEPGQDIVVSIIPNVSGGTALFPSDYGRDVAGTVTFIPGGPTEVTTQLRILNDDRLEFDETFPIILQLTPAAITAGGQLGLRREAEVTIINDDTEQVLFLQDMVTTDEGRGQASFSVTFTPQRTDIPFTVIVETFDTTPADAIAGIDYQPLRTNVTLSPSIASETLTVPIIQDQITERTESFRARIIVPEETQQLGVQLGSLSELTVHIQDDDFSGDLEITCSTNVTGDNINGRMIQLFFEANQDATFRCRTNNEAYTTCTSPFIFRNVDISESITVSVEGTTTLRNPSQTVIRTKRVFVAEGGLQVVGVGAIAVGLQASKNATYRCRLNNGQYVNCVDGQVFSGLAAGTYTLFIEATVADNPNEVAYDVVGPIVIIAGAGADRHQAIAACFGKQTYRCDSNGQNCDYVANWRTRGDRVEFSLVAQTQGWVGIGFSSNNRMEDSDIIVGAASSAGFFVDDRFATAYVQPPRDDIQNVDSASASFVNGITTVMFSRDKITNDTNQDIQLDRCVFFIYAWSGNADINTGEIQYHGSQNRVVSQALICLPSADFCPERFNCGDPGTPDNGGRVLMPNT